MRIMMLVLGIGCAGCSFATVHGSTTPSSGEPERTITGEANVQPRVVTTPSEVPAGPQPASTAPVSGMVRIPAGVFNMGSNPGENNEKPVHRVSVGAFSIDVTEVTMGAYSACVNAGKCTTTDVEANKYCNWGKSDRTNHPMNCVDWTQAAAYCTFADKRLPSEEEWEYAARGNDGRTYAWGNDAPGDRACWNGDGNELGKLKRQNTCSVGSHPSGASAFGVQDMAGNVWEWTSSKSCPYTVESNSCASAAHIYRGGGWYNAGPLLLRVARRVGDMPAYRDTSLGFRCAQAIM